MFFDSDNIISKKIAAGIEHIIELQIQQRPFSKMQLSSVDLLRLKTCLAIYDLAYAVFCINVRFWKNKDRLKKLVDLTYKEYYALFKRNYSLTLITISDIVVNLNEQQEVIRISREWHINYELDVKTPIYNLFEILYDYRMDLYLDAITKGFKNDKEEVGRFIPVIYLFETQFKGSFSKTDFAVEFDYIINNETLDRISKMIKNFKTD